MKGMSGLGTDDSNKQQNHHDEETEGAHTTQSATKETGNNDSAGHCIAAVVEKKQQAPSGQPIRSSTALMETLRTSRKSLADKEPHQYIAIATSWLQNYNFFTYFRIIKYVVCLYFYAFHL